jgi:hypothetical protein
VDLLRRSLERLTEILVPSAAAALVLLLVVVDVDVNDDVVVKVVARIVVLLSGTWVPEVS